MEKDKDGKDISWGDIPKFRNGSYAIWERPAPGFRFNNVATAASITGAARAVLLEAIQNADDPIYCDTDSLICRDLKNTRLHKTELGAWDTEKELDEVLIAGKKTYAYKVAGLPDGHKDRIIVRSKGASDRTWQDVERMIAGETIDAIAKGPTLTKYGTQMYMRRALRATTPRIVSTSTYHERVRYAGN
jgi:DNA polymerase elongation subunit (family B)